MSDDISKLPDFATADSNKPQRKFTLKEKKTAIHESGHIMACLVQRVPFEYATIRKSNNVLGQVVVDFRNVSLEQQISIVLAGSAAERLLVPKRNRSICDWMSSRADHQEALSIISELRPEWKEDEDSVTEFLKAMRHRAERIIEFRRVSVLAIASALLSGGGRLTEDQAKELLESLEK